MDRKRSSFGGGSVHAAIPPFAQADGLCVLCADIHYIADLFEEHDDEDGLAMLRRPEDECC